MLTRNFVARIVAERRRPCCRSDLRVSYLLEKPIKQNRQTVRIRSMTTHRDRTRATKAENLRKSTWKRSPRRRSAGGLICDFSSTASDPATGSARSASQALGGRPAGDALSRLTGRCSYRFKLRCSAVNAELRPLGDLPPPTPRARPAPRSRRRTCAWHRTAWPSRRGRR